MLSLTHIERAFVDFLSRNIFIPSRSKIALIGEETKNKRDNAVCQTISKRYEIPLKNITIFTGQNKFRVEDGEKFDFIMGCRPCEAERVMLDSAEKYGKRIIMMPCVCHGLASKAAQYIKDYSIITRVDAAIQDKLRAWLVVYNQHNRTTVEER